MVAEAAENTEWRLQARKRFYHLSLHCRIPAGEVPGQRQQIPLQTVRDGCVATNLISAHEGANMEIGKLDNAKALEGLGQARQEDALASDFQVKSAIEKAVGSGDKGGSTKNRRRLLEELPPAG